MPFILNLIVFFVIISIFEIFLNSFVEQYSLPWWLLIIAVFIVTDTISEIIAPTPMGSLLIKK